MFAKRLRSARMARHFTQQAMADALNLSLNAYQKYEQGERTAPYDTLVAIADKLNISIDWLLGRDEYLCSLGVSFDEF